MNRKEDYQVTCSYDLTQTNDVRYDNTIVKAFEKVGGVFINKDSDEYGARDITVGYSGDLTTLHKVVKDLLTDVQKKDVKMSITAKKVEYHITLENKGFSDFEGFNALVASWSVEKNASYQNSGDSFKLIVHNLSQLNDFKVNILPQSSIFMKNNSVPVFVTDETSENVLNLDNYTSKKKLSHI